MDLDSYLKRGEELAQSLDLNELTDAGMEKLEDIALQMAHGAWNPTFYPGIGATADKLWHDVFDKNIYDLSIEVDIPEEGFWHPFDPAEDEGTDADSLFADFADEDEMAAENGDDPFVRPDYTALKVLLTATDNRAAHAGDQFILAVIYVRVELPLNTFEQQAPSAATIFLFPELQAQTGATNSVTLDPSSRFE